jgi:hypothetical protein
MARSKTSLSLAAAALILLAYGDLPDAHSESNLLQR